MIGNNTRGADRRGEISKERQMNRTQDRKEANRNDE